MGIAALDARPRHSYLLLQRAGATDSGFQPYQERSMSTLAITDKSFDAEVAKSALPVVVDFWAEWCGPCKAIGPALEQIAGEMGGKVKITKLNIDENPEITNKFKILAIPTLMIFKDGKVAATQTGALPKTKIE